MGYVADSVISALRLSGPLGLYLHLATTPALRIWAGVSDCRAGIDSVDPAGVVYRGAGRLVEVPEIDLLINGQADEVSFGFSGVDADFVSHLSREAPEVRGAKVFIGIAPLDARWQPMSSIVPLWRGVADRWGSSRKAPKDPTKNPVHSIALFVGVGDTSRAQHKAATFTPSWQETRTTGDRFFERVPRYVQQQLTAWPRF